jgi:hypothetical protein
VEKECVIKQCVFKKLTALLELSFPNMTIPSTLHLFFIFLGTGFDMVTVVKVHNAV